MLTLCNAFKMSCLLVSSYAFSIVIQTKSKHVFKIPPFSCYLSNCKNYMQQNKIISQTIWVFCQFIFHLIRCESNYFSDQNIITTNYLKVIGSVQTSQTCFFSSAFQKQNKKYGSLLYFATYRWLGVCKNDHVGKLTTILMYNLCNSHSCIKILHPLSPSHQRKL